MTKYRDCFVRAGKTFLQAFLAVVSTSLMSQSALQGSDVRRILVSAVIAGAAALFSFGQNAMKVSKDG